MRQLINAYMFVETVLILAFALVLFPVGFFCARAASGYRWVLTATKNRIQFWKRYVLGEDE